MITGANTNIRYRGIVFHVQTEDSGRANPHIISHLYHGGTILASEKTEYGDRMETADLESMVRGLIEEQHRDLVRRLQSGAYDAVIEERLGHEAIQPTGPIDTPTPAPEVDAVLEPGEASTQRPSEAASPPPPQSDAPRAPERAFGEGVVSQRPLDEMILDYLADKARGRSSGRVVDTARKSSSDG